MNTNTNYALIQPLTTASTIPIARVGSQEKLSIYPQIMVSPNPFSDKVKVETKLRGIVSVYLYDVMGNNYYQQIHQLERGELLLDLVAIEMKAGYYLLKLQAEDGQSQLIKVLKK